MTKTQSETSTPYWRGPRGLDLRSDRGEPAANEMDRPEVSPTCRRGRSGRSGRSGSILPQLAFMMVAICGFMALAIDIGMMALARTQCQNAADAAAMAGARRLDGSDNPDLTAATNQAKATAKANRIMAAMLRDADIDVEHGAYHYDRQNEIFTPQYPPQAPDNHNLTKVVVTHNRNSAFARFLGMPDFTVTTSAVAAHRPRDVTIILDFSGSMNNESDLWNNEGYLGSVNNTSNSLEEVFPEFGHFSDKNAAALKNKSKDPRVGKSNVAVTALGIAPLVNDFFQHSWAQPLVSAFTPAPDDYAVVPDGDNFPPKFGTSTKPPTYAKTVQEVTGATGTQISNKSDPPMTPYPAYKGYTGGPRYWGKTFFIWPPDPDVENQKPYRDWRKQFFLMPGGSHPNFGGPLSDNTRLWDASGNWKPPVSGSTTNYVINYQAILAWVKKNPSPFPSQLRAGKILYYDAIPDDVPASAYNWSNAASAIKDQNQRFWKEYIDYTIGVWRDPFGNVQAPGNPACSMGPDFTWGTIKVSAPVTGYATVPKTRVHPQDNPKRPRHRFWFGPLTMVQFISDTGLLPGTAHDISMYSAKTGIQGALEDIRNNHPNDLVSLILFNRPRFDKEPPEAGRFSKAQYTLSRDYTGMINALWFPPNTKTNDVRPWDPDGMQTPRAYGDFTANTCTNYGLMLAYNQLSGNKDLRDNVLGGEGRKGAQRLIILETDGMANVAANAGFADFGPNQSYFKLSAADSVTPGGSAGDAARAIARRLVAPETGSADSPGYSTLRKPVVMHCLAFGPIFESTASGTEPANAMKLLQDISAIGGTGFPASVTDTGSPFFFKLCTGTLEERKTKLRQAFTRIMDEQVSISLVR